MALGRNQVERRRSMTRIPTSRRSALKSLSLAGAALAVLPAGAAQAENQPHMQNALDALRQADRELGLASRDKGGHRGRAVGYVKRAIVEVENGMKYDNRR
jgi:hypothetical protein